MDIVLEAFNSYGFDRFWATILPASKATFLTNMLKEAVPSATFSSMREAPTAFRPASQYLSFEPGRYAYMSALPRDNMWRQGVTLFLITWYV
jgi:Delta7-sterol 5-desaturase